MASHGFFGLQCANPGAKLICGSFAPDTAGAVTAVKGRGFSVARTGTGQFTITFRQKYSHMLAFFGGIQMAANTDLKLQAGAYSAANRTLVLTALAIATATDIAANANNRVHFMVVMQATSAPAV